MTAARKTAGIRVRVVRLEHALNLPLPDYQSKGAAGLDLVAVADAHTLQVHVTGTHRVHAFAPMLKAHVATTRPEATPRDRIVLRRRVELLVLLTAR